MEALLQGFLYEDAEAYPSDAVYREQLIGRLKAAGCIRRNKVVLTKNEEVSRVLTASRGKLNSINAIIRAERESMGERLRLLVLCDFIKKEMISAVGHPEKKIHEIGAVPIFENIRREEIHGLRLGVLSGSVVILPLDYLEEELEGLSCLQGCTCSMDPLGDTGYGKVTVRGKGQHTVSAVTELFERGRIHVIDRYEIASGRRMGFSLYQFSYSGNLCGFFYAEQPDERTGDPGEQIRSGKDQQYMASGLYSSCEIRGGERTGRGL